jgi:uncharacterized membrane protein (UPF0127 family)
MKIFNKTKGTLLAEHADLADTLFLRMKGLLDKNDIKKGQALIITPCDSIHTFFMRFAIDVIFVDRRNRVDFTITSIKPWRLSRLCWRAKFAIELPSGVIRDSHTEKGDEISITD